MAGVNIEKQNGVPSARRSNVMRSCFSITCTFMCLAFLLLVYLSVYVTFTDRKLRFDYFTKFSSAIGMFNQTAKSFFELNTIQKFEQSNS